MWILVWEHHQFIMPLISKDCSKHFSWNVSFIYAAPCERNKLSEHIRTSNFDCFRKSVKNNVIYTTIWMLTVNKNIYIYYRFIVRFPIHRVGLPLHNIPSLFLFCHGHLLCRSRVLPCPLLHSLTMSLVFQPVFFLQLYTPIHFFTQSSSLFLITCPYHLILCIQNGKEETYKNNMVSSKNETVVLRMI